MRLQNLTSLSTIPTQMKNVISLKGYKSNFLTFLWSVLLSIGVSVQAFAQNTITAPFNTNSQGFVGDVSNGNSASSCVSPASLGWSNFYFSQNSSTNIFVAQGNDIIGNIIITDNSGVVHSIPGYLKWRTPSGSVSTFVYQPTAGVSEVLATNGSNGSATYTITDLKYVGLTKIGYTLTIPGSGNINGNAANTMLNELNAYLSEIPSISISNQSVNENAGTVTITATLSATSTNTVTVNYATADSTAQSGLDYTATSGTLTFAPGETIKTITIPITNDILLESAEKLKLIFTNPAFAYVLNSQVLITIIDDETNNTPPSISSISDQTGCGSFGPLNFTIADTETAAANLVVTASAVNQTLLPNGNIIIGGTGANRTISFNTVTGVAGSTDVNVVVEDLDGAQAYISFMVTVDFTIDAGLDQTICSGSSASLNATVIDNTVSSSTTTTYDFNNGWQGWSTVNLLTTMYGEPSASSLFNVQSFGNSGNSLGTPNTGFLGAEHSYVVSPVLSFGSSVTLSFDSYSNNEPSTGLDVEYIEYSIDNGATWINITSQLNPGGLQDLYDDATWKSYTVTFNVTPTSTGLIRFRYDTGDGCCGGSGINNGWYIDNVSVTESTASTYAWTPSATLSCNDCLTPTAMPTTTTMYTLTGTSSTGCVITDSVLVTVNTTPNVANVSNQTLCAGESTTAINFTSTSGATGIVYNWTNTNASIGLAASGSGDIAAFTTTNSSNTNATAAITVTPTANGCTGSPMTFNINVNAVPTVSVTSSQVVTDGTVVPVVNTVGNNVAGAVYNWTNSNTAIGLAGNGIGNVSSFTATNTTCAPISGTFNVSATANGCTGPSQSYTITVAPVPQIDPISNQTICAGSSTAAVAFTGCTANTSYVWTNDTPSIGLVSSGSGNIAAFNATNTSNSPVTATITVTPEAYVTQGYVWGAISEDGFLTLTAPAGKIFTSVDFASFGNPTGSLGNYTIGSCHATTSTSVISGLALGNSSMTVQAHISVFGEPCFGTAKTLAVKLGYGVLTSGTPETFTYTVNPTPSITAQAATICSSSSFSVTPANGSGNIVPANTTYTWTVAANANVSGQSNQTVAQSSISQTLTNLTDEDQTVVYTVTPVSATGPCTGSTFTISVTVLPAMNIANVNSSICTGSTFSITPVNGAAADIVPSGTLYTWLATPNANIAGASNQSSPQANISQTIANNAATTIQQIYSVTPEYTAAGLTCYGAPFTITLDVVSGLPSVNVGANQTICNTGNASFTVSASNVETGYWVTSGNGTITPNVTNTPTITYEPAIGESGNINIIYVATNLCGTNSDTAVLSITAQPSAGVISGTTSVCAGSNTVLTSSVTGGTWSSSNTAIASINSASGELSGITQGSAVVTYTVSVGGCSTSTTAAVTVNSLPVVSALTGSTNVCQGATTTLASATSGGSWSSSNNSVASVNASGVVTGVAPGTATISYTVTGSNGCSSTSSASVTVNAVPTASITAGGSTTFCQGGSVTLTASSGASYLWSNGAQTQSITVSSAGSYTVMVTNAAGCSVTSAATTVSVNSLPTANILTNGPLTFCQGGSVTLTASPIVAGNTYLWSNGATTSSINVTSSSTVTLTVTNTNGCSTTSIPTSVNVFANPTATITASGSTTFCQGGSVVLTANAGSGYAYQWSNNTNNQLLTVNSSGSYTVTVTDANGCSVTSAPTVVTVNALPSAAAITGTSSVCVGGTTLLSTSASSPVWSSANTSVATVATNGLVTGVSAGTAVISYTITNANGCSNTASVTVTVNHLPTAAIATVGATTFCQGGSVTLLASNAPAGMTYSYQWRLNGTAITGATNNSFVANASGNYAVTITTNNGCSATSATTTVTVNPLPVLAANTGSASVCENGTVTLANAQSGGLWSTANNTVAAVNAVTGVVTGINPGTTTLTYTYTNANGCTNTASTNFTVNALPSAVISANGPTTFCQGGSVTLTASSGSSYLWSTGATTQSIVVSNTQDVTVTITNANGCSATSAITSVLVNANPVANITSLNGNSFCQGGSVTLVASTGSAYAWSNGAITQSIVVSATESLTVTVTNSAGCSSTSAPFAVTMNPAPVATITASGSTTFCNGGSVVLSAPAAASYLWSSGETTQTILATVDGPYSVTITDGNGCSATSANTNITVLSTPSVQAIAGSNALCVGATSVLTNTTIGGVWTSGNSSVATISTGGQVTGIAAGSVTMTYTVTNANGCSNAASVLLNIYDLPVLTPIAGTATVCQGSTTTLANAQAGGTWSSSNVAIATVAANGVVSGLSAGTATITYTYTNNAGCTSSVDQALIVNALPTASIAVSGATTFCFGDSVTLTAPTASSYAWSTGAPTQSITVMSSGNYTVTLTDANGCSSTSSSLAVTVNALPAVSIASIGATTLCVGESVTLISPLNSTYNYSWNNGAGSIAGAFGNTYVASTSGDYSLTITDGNGCTATSSTISVTVNALPVVTAVANGNTTFCAGGNVTLTATGAATYVWNNGATSPTITVAASGTYSVIGTSIEGCSSSSNTIAVTVNALPVASISSTGSTVCLGSTVTLTANGGATYLWSNNATTPSIDVTNANTYSVVVTSPEGCSSTASETVIFNANPAVSITTSGPTVFCQGSSLTLNATGGSNYVWSNGDQGASTVVNQSGSYFVTVTNAAGCSTLSSIVNVTVNPVPVVASINGGNSVCEGGNITLTSATPGGIWNATNNFIANIDGAGNVTGLNAGTTTITYTVSMNGCSATTVAQVNVLNNPVTPTITASGATSVCPGSSVVLFASNAANYQWSNGPTTPFMVATQSGTYTVTATGLNGCSATSLPVSVFIGDNTAPVITAPLNVTVTPNLGCEAIGVTLGTPTTSDNCSVASVTNNAPAIYPIGTTIVTWTVTDGSGNVSTATQLVTVVDQTAPTAFAPANVTIASNNFCEATGVDLGLPIATDNCTNNLAISNNAPSTYPLGTTIVTWTITDGAGNITTVEQSVTVTDETAPTVLLANTSVILNSEGFAVVAFEDLDNGSSDNCGIASVVLSQSTFDCSNVGNNLISVTITDNSGNQSSAQVMVTVIASDACGGSNWAGPSVPDAFTPNGNNFNDTWVIPGLEGYNTKEMTVYSRYGTLVHYSEKYNNDWDGTLLNTGTPVPDGTYYYILNLDGGKQLNGYVYINRVKQ